jgi:hypothetical protein
LQFGDTRRAFHQLLRVHGPNRTVGSKRVLGLGFEPGYYTLREVTKSGAYILVREDLPTPTAYTWERLSVVSKSYSKRPPELALYTRRPVGALSQLLRAELNFSMAFMVEVSPKPRSFACGRPRLTTKNPSGCRRAGPPSLGPLGCWRLG